MNLTGRPNVVLIVADDMGYGDFGVFSEGVVRTPVLDALVGRARAFASTTRPLPSVPPPGRRC